jgi:thiol-disulfide isomerase/thioredoxin
MGKCRVTGSLESTEYVKLGGDLERSIVNVWTDPGLNKVEYINVKGAAFTVDLPPGDYKLVCTGNGSRGATFVPAVKKFTVKPGDTKIELGAIDMPASKITKLFGRPAPELEGVVGWKNTAPLTLKGLKGKVVVLDFWSWSCTICIHHKPDLSRLLDRYKDRGLAVLTVHDDSVATIEEMDRKLPDAAKRKGGGLPVALDGKGDKGIFASFGIEGVPAVVLIDQEGKVVRRFHHAGDPELDREVKRLLDKAK